MRSIGPAELDERRSADDVFVLDVRPASAYRDGHISGSHNAPVYHELQEGNTDALEQHVSAIPADTDVVTVCKAGVVARSATEYLAENGYTAMTLTGGYAGWRQYEQDTVLYRIAAVLGKLTS